MTEDFLFKKLEERKQQNAFRELRLPDGKCDFCSNDYLGIVTNGLIETHLAAISPAQNPFYRSGSTGSRLLAGNYQLIEDTESFIASFHKAEAGLLFNSGYDANTGLLSCIPQKGDTIIYDYLAHASLRDGARLSLARSFSFKHNDPEDLEHKLRQATGNIFVVTESVFSMDGDTAPLEELIAICSSYKAHIIIDEAHATGVIGSMGEGLVQLLGLEDKCFARVHTFGKACGAHGAIVLGSNQLRQYLVNFCRQFIYTTSLPETCIASIRSSYQLFPHLHQERKQLGQLIKQFQQGSFKNEIIESDTPVQAVVIPGNDEVKTKSAYLQQSGFDIRPILYPTVPKGTERLRIVLHSFNTTDEVSRIIKLLN